MQIDWITVAAQIVNFLVLVWLLHHFLYRPITQAMERREKRIAERLRDAAEKKKEAAAEADKYRQQQEDLERRRQDLLDQARKEASEEKESLQQSARDEVARRKEEWHAQLEEQKTRFLSELRRKSAMQFYELARKALSDLADADLEDRIAAVFVARLAQLDKETRDRLRKACRDGQEPVVVSSHFDLSPAAKRRITMAVHDTVGDQAEVDYRLTEDIACGVELKLANQTVSFTLDDYLDRLQESLRNELSGAGEAA